MKGNSWNSEKQKKGSAANSKPVKTTECQSAGSHYSRSFLAALVLAGLPALSICTLAELNSTGGEKQPVSLSFWSDHFASIPAVTLPELNPDQVSEIF